MGQLKLNRRGFFGLAIVGCASAFLLGNIPQEFIEDIGNEVSREVSRAKRKDYLASLDEISEEVKKSLEQGKTREEIATSYMMSNDDLTEDEMEIIKQTFIIMDEISEKHFIKIMHALEHVHFQYLDIDEAENTYSRSSICGCTINCYEDENGINEKSIINSLYCLFGLEHAFDDQIQALIDNGVSKYDIANEYLNRNNYLNEEEKEIIRPVCQFLDSYADNDNFKYALTKLRLLNIDYSQSSEDDFSAYDNSYLIYSFKDMDEQIILYEAFRAINMGNSCLEKAMSELLTNEYKKSETSNYNRHDRELVVLKMLCEIIGTEKMLNIYMSGTTTCSDIELIEHKPTIINALLAINKDTKFAKDFIDTLEEFIKSAEEKDGFASKHKKKINLYLQGYFAYRYGYDAYDDVIMSYYLSCDHSATDFVDETNYRIDKAYFCEDKMPNDRLIKTDGTIFPLNEAVACHYATMVKA